MSSIFDKTPKVTATKGLPNDNNEVTKQINETLSERMKKTEERIKSEISIPTEYIPISLSTKGKFGCPETIHVKNFTTEQVMEFSSQIDPIETQKSLIKLLNSIIFEDFPVEKLTKKEMIELIVTIYANYYSSFLEQEYEPTEDDIAYMKSKNPSLYEQYKRGEYSPTISIPITSEGGLKLVELPEDFKEPIRIVDKKSQKTFFFTFPRMETEVLVAEYINNLYAEIDEQLLPIIREFEKESTSDKINPVLTFEERRQFNEYQRVKAFDTIKAYMLTCLVGVDDLKLDTYEEKEPYLTSALDAMIRFNNFVAGFQFCIDENIEIRSPITGKTETRRLEFRPIDVFTKAIESKSDQYDVEFG